jgi:hypothetical protein
MAARSKEAPAPQTQRKIAILNWEILGQIESAPIVKDTC